MYIQQYIQWEHDTVRRNGEVCLKLDGVGTAEMALEVYRQNNIGYPKFFKMDILSKVAFLCAELLGPYEEGQKEGTAVVLSTASGCLSADLDFEQSRKTLASPALFVYTLPNIMLGEICIRHGFKGEQMCTVTPLPDVEWMAFYVTDLLLRRGASACLFGHIEATREKISASMMLANRNRTGTPLDSSHLKNIFPGYSF